MCVNWFVLGAKFSQTAACTRIIETDGTSLTLESTNGVQHLAPETRELWEYVHEVNTGILDDYSNNNVASLYQ